MSTPTLTSKRKSGVSIFNTNIAHILIPFDGENAESTIHYIRHGVYLAKALHSKVTLMHVAKAEQRPTTPTEAKQLDQARKDIDKVVRRAKQLLESSLLSHSLIVVQGHADERILAHPCDLIVLGTHSHRAADEHTIGSVVTQVLRAASVPVLTIRSLDMADSTTTADSTADDSFPSTSYSAMPTSSPLMTADKGDSEGTPNGTPLMTAMTTTTTTTAAAAVGNSALSKGDNGAIQYRQILVCYDGTSLVDNAILRVAPIARMLRATVTLVYALDAALYPDEMQRRKQMDAAEAFLRRGKTLAEQEGIVSVRTQLDIAPRHAEDHLLMLAAAKSVDLVVVGTHGRSGIDRVLFGSVAERLLRLCPKPLLVVGRNSVQKDNGAVLNTAYAALPLSPAKV